MDGLNFSFRKPRKNDVIEGTVVRVTEDMVYLDINFISEGIIHKDKFTTENVDLRTIVKEGDVIKAVVGDVRDEEHTYVLMSRLPLLKEEKFEEIKKLFKNKETITAKVIKNANDKGLVLNYFGFEIFVPEGQVELNEKPVLDNYVGKNLDVLITDVDDSKKRIVASHRAILWNEYKEARQKELESINVGDVLTGTVSEIKPYGALVKFQYNQGLLKIGNIAHTRVDKIEDVIKVGDSVLVKVIAKDGNKIDLSKKALLKTPYELYAEAHKVSDTVSGKVLQKLPFGIILELDKDVTGLLHKNEFSWNPNDNFESYVKIGDVLNLAITKIDTKAKKISLSKKALEDNPWARVDAKVGDLACATVDAIIPGKGLEVTAYGVKGFIPASELSNKDRVNKIEDFFAVGDEVKGRVIEVNKAEWVLKISIRRLEAEIERKQFEEYKQDDAPSMTLGDRFKDLLK